MVPGITILDSHAAAWLKTRLQLGRDAGCREATPRRVVRRATKLLHPLRDQHWRAAHPQFPTADDDLRTAYSVGVWLGLDHGLFGIAFGRVPDPYGWDSIPTYWHAETIGAEEQVIRDHVRGLVAGLEHARVVAATLGVMLSLPRSIPVTNPATDRVWMVPVDQPLGDLPSEALAGWFPHSEWGAFQDRRLGADGR